MDQNQQNQQSQRGPSPGSFQELPRPSSMGAHQQQGASQALQQQYQQQQPFFPVNIPPGPPAAYNQGPFNNQFMGFNDPFQNTRNIGQQHRQNQAYQHLTHNSGAYSSYSYGGFNQNNTRNTFGPFGGHSQYPQYQPYDTMGPNQGHYSQPQYSDMSQSQNKAHSLGQQALQYYQQQQQNQGVYNHMHGGSGGSLQNTGGFNAQHSQYYNQQSPGHFPPGPEPMNQQEQQGNVGVSPAYHPDFHPFVTDQHPITSEEQRQPLAGIITHSTAQDQVDPGHHTPEHARAGDQRPFIPGYYYDHQGSLIRVGGHHRHVNFPHVDPAPMQQEQLQQVMRDETETPAGLSSTTGTLPTSAQVGSSMQAILEPAAEQARVAAPAHTQQQDQRSRQATTNAASTSSARQAPSSAAGAGARAATGTTGMATPALERPFAERMAEARQAFISEAAQVPVNQRIPAYPPPGLFHLAEEESPVEPATSPTISPHGGASGGGSNDGTAARAHGHGRGRGRGRGLGLGSTPGSRAIVPGTTTTTPDPAAAPGTGGSRPGSGYGYGYGRGRGCGGGGGRAPIAVVVGPGVVNAHGPRNFPQYHVVVDRDGEPVLPGGFAPSPATATATAATATATAAAAAEAEAQDRAYRETLARAQSLERGNRERAAAEPPLTGARSERWWKDGFGDDDEFLPPELRGEDSDVEE